MACCHPAGGLLSPAARRPPPCENQPLSLVALNVRERPGTARSPTHDSQMGTPRNRAVMLAVTRAQVRMAWRAGVRCAYWGGPPARRPGSPAISCPSQVLLLAPGRVPGSPFAWLSSCPRVLYPLSFPGGSDGREGTPPLAHWGAVPGGGQRGHDRAIGRPTGTHGDSGVCL